MDYPLSIAIFALSILFIMGKFTHSATWLNSGVFNMGALKAYLILSSRKCLRVYLTDPNL
jgi:hypothetical protein